jgi:hypothetical protein
VPLPSKTPDKVVVPLPPFATAIVVPHQVPVVIVPTPVKLEVITLLASVVPEIVPAKAVIPMLPEPFAIEIPNPGVNVVLVNVPVPVPISI